MARIVYLLLAVACAASAQSRALPQSDVQVIYKRLAPQIDKIKIFDHHAHPGFADDPDVDAQAFPPTTHTPFRLREDNPEILAALKGVFGYPYADLSAEHTKWLADKTAAEKKLGTQHFDALLDKLNIESSVANRVAMAPYLNPKRFRWVFFCDSFLFPLDNKQPGAANPDMGIFFPMQEKVLKRYLQQAGLNALPQTFDAYLSFVTKILEDNQRKGGIAEKFEVAYFRSLAFGDPPKAQAAQVYAKYVRGGTPSAAEYTAFQDYIFRYLITEGGRLHLPIHIHSAVGGGDYFSLQRGTVIHLDNILKDPRYSRTTFVLIHGGYPYYREAAWMSALDNVYLDSSEVELFVYPHEFKDALRFWLETFPEKVTFGSDAFPFTSAVGPEVAYWLGVMTARDTLATVLAEMIASREITEQKALDMAHGYLHDNAVKLYPKQ
jgi:hypothetical protein